MNQKNVTIAVWKIMQNPRIIKAGVKEVSYDKGSRINVVSASENF